MRCDARVVRAGAASTRLARNVGVLAALSAGCENIASSNIDVIPPARHLLDCFTLCRAGSTRTRCVGAR